MVTSMKYQLRYLLGSLHCEWEGQGGKYSSIWYLVIQHNYQRQKLTINREDLCVFWLLKLRREKLKLFEICSVDLDKAWLR